MCWKVTQGVKMTERAPYGYWKNWANVERELKKVIEGNDGDFPTNRSLRDSGNSSLIRAIALHGGTREVRRKLGFVETLRRDKETAELGSWEKLSQKLGEVMEENGLDNIPSETTLENLGYGYVYRAMLKHGGINSVRKKLGISTRDTKPRGWWKNPDNFYGELNPIIDKLGRFPTTFDLVKMNRGDIAGAAQQHYGGWERVRQEASYSEPVKKRELEGVLESYTGGEESG